MARLTGTVRIGRTHNPRFAAQVESPAPVGFSARLSPSPAPVAQGIERRFPKPCVAGSNPAGGATNELVTGLQGSAALGIRDLADREDAREACGCRITA
jgi:hypothetical protein